MALKASPAVDFSAFYSEHVERVLCFHQRRCRDADTALDLMAETFAQALAGRRTFRGGTDAEASAWLFGIARNQLANYVRRSRIERTALLRLRSQAPGMVEDDLARIDARVDVQAMRGRVLQQFDRLSPEQRRALRMRVVDELDYPEVALRLQVSEQAARARVHRGLRQLAASLEPKAVLA